MIPLPGVFHFQFCFMSSNFDIGVKEYGIGFDRINRRLFLENSKRYYFINNRKVDASDENIVRSRFEFNNIYK